MNEKLLGRLRAARALGQFARCFRNWREVWSAYRMGAPLPPLELRCGLTIGHGPGDDPILLFREIFVDECYTQGGFYRPRREDVVLDIGANIGMFGLWLQSKAKGIHVHGFEPSSESRARLEQNIKGNHLDGLIQVHAYAVTDTRATVSLKRAGSNGDRSLFDRVTAVDEADEVVRSISLDDAIALAGAPSIDLLKIDVEGSEIEIVEGAGAASWSKVKRVALEYHDLFRPGCRERVTTVLKNQGFTSIETIPVPGVPGLGLIRASRQAGSRTS